MADLDRSIANLGDKIDELAVQVSALTDTVTRLEGETREHRQVSELQAQNIQSLSVSVAQLISLAQQQQATVDRLLAKN